MLYESLYGVWCIPYMPIYYAMQHIILVYIIFSLLYFSLSTIYILIIHIYNIFSVTWISNVGLWDNDYGKWDMIGQKCSGISYPYEAFNIRHKLFY